MYYSPTQIDIALLKQQAKNVYVKVNLLDHSFKILDSLECNLISDNLNVDSQSKQRRSYSCELYVSDPSFLLGSNKKIWIDKYIQVFYGIEHIRTKEIHYYLLGTFSYSSADYTYNSTTNQVSLKCPDLMADYDGTKNGQLSGYKLIIPAGENIRNSIIGTLNMAGITKYYVEDVGKEIPYDLEFTGTVTYCDIWTKICELYDSLEFFFDVDGTFVWRQIPTGLHEPVVFDDTLLDQIWISESASYDFTQIFNKTEVWGKILELQYEDRYTEECTFSNGVYTIKLPKIGNMEVAQKTENQEIIEYVENIDELDHLDQIGIKICTDSIGGDLVKIGTDIIPIVNDDGTPIIAGRMKSGQIYVFSYRRNQGKTIQNCLYLLGQYQCYGVYEEVNEECPFSIKNLGYEIVNRVDYDQLYSDDLCYNQAEFLTYQSTALQDTLNLELIIIPWLDVNQKIKYTSKQSNETNQYMIKSFSWSSLSGTMSMTLYKFRESFSYVKNKDKEANASKWLMKLKR